MDKLVTWKKCSTVSAEVIEEDRRAKAHASKN